jgi:hypothetical protein
MSRVFVFADEAGNFDFSRNTGASKYFILTTVTLPDCSVGVSLLELRRELAWEGIGLNCEFHATEDKQAVRDRVFAVIEKLSMRIDATILEKCKAQPRIRTSEEEFYKFAWFYHMRHLAPRIVTARDELLVIGASLGIKKKRSVSHAAVKNVIGRVSPTIRYQVASWDAASDPCLQIADYCAWAIQRRWERGDNRSYALIASQIQSEYELFSAGTVDYY